VAIPLHGGALPAAGGQAEPVPCAPTDPADLAEATMTLPLVRLAWARSGDKGNVSNIGVIARRPEWLPLLWSRLTTERVRDWFAYLMQGEVERFWLPGIGAINFLLHDALDGGGPASHRLDPLGKGMAQMLLEMPIEVPASVARKAGA
jgi:hypothetical protein